MPAPLAHAAYALRYQELHPDGDVRRLVRGSVFPDSHRVTGLTRDQTHQTHAPVTAEQIAGASDGWEVGWLLHSQLDQLWNRYMEDFGLVQGRVTDEPTWLALKLLEHERLLVWQPELAHLALMFDGQPDSHELAMGVRPEAVAQWDEWIGFILAHSYTMPDWAVLVRQHLGYVDTDIDIMLDRARELAGSTDWRLRLEGLWRQLHYGPQVAP